MSTFNVKVAKNTEHQLISQKIRVIKVQLMLKICLNFLKNMHSEIQTKFIKVKIFTSVILNGYLCA